MTLPLDQSDLLRDLLLAAYDDTMADIVLEGNDGCPVNANRFILCARSKVFKRMLYGNFKEAKSPIIHLPDYASVTLEAVVEYCSRNEIHKFRLNPQMLKSDCISARYLAQLVKAADYFELPGLVDMVSTMTHSLINRYPPLACAVYDEADPFTSISQKALCMIQCRPYVTLPPHEEKGGGVESLSANRMESVLQDGDVQAGEYFLFQMFQLWVELHASTEHVDLVVQACGQHLRLENIEPQDLLGSVTQSNLFSESQITKAITLQALRASQIRTWNLACRGRPDGERILVEGAGIQDANGLYYRIDGLANGELFSKREVSCGQQFVYTLSRTTNNKQVECRIFCSKLLTHRAVKTFVNNRVIDPTFQPLLQILHIDTSNKDETSDVNGRNATNSTARSVAATTSAVNSVAQEGPVIKLLLSDGDYYLSATVTPELYTAVSKKELKRNSLIKILQYTTDVKDDKLTLQLHKISLISQDPGHRFGNPIDYSDAFDEDEDEDEDQSNGYNSPEPLVLSSSNTPIEARFCREMMMQQPTQDSRQSRVNGGSGILFPKGSKNHPLCELYSCQYSVNDKITKDLKIPMNGWRCDNHGTAPGPTCRWIPAPTTVSASELATPNDVEPKQIEGGNSINEQMNQKESEEVKYQVTFVPKT